MGFGVEVLGFRVWSGRSSNLGLGMQGSTGFVFKKRFHCFEPAVHCARSTGTTCLRDSEILSAQTPSAFLILEFRNF